MATMGAKKRMVSRIIQNNRAKRFDDGAATHEKVMSDSVPVSKEEHDKRLEMLKSLGIMKK